MGIWIAGLLVAFSGLLYAAGTNRALAPICTYTFGLCATPSWPLWAAGLFFAFGMLFRLQK